MKNSLEDRPFDASEVKKRHELVVLIVQWKYQLASGLIEYEKGCFMIHALQIKSVH